jgi:polar amino acid transport system substrate-binding protein
MSMKKCFLPWTAAAFLIIALALGFTGGSTAMAADEDVRMALVKQSTLEEILQRGELRVGFEAGYVPFEMTDKKGNFVGFDIDMAKDMAKAMGVKFVPVNTAWDGIIPALLTKKFDIIMSGMTITQERNLKINFCDPYIVVGQTILLNKKHEGTVKSYKDLNDPKYIVTSKLGTTGEQAVKRMIPKATYKSFETETEAALEVVNGKADAYVYDQPNCVVFMAEQGKDKLVFLDEPFTYEPLAWAVRKGDPDFINWLNNFLRQYKNDGRYEVLYNKWIKSTDWYANVK